MFWIMLGILALALIAYLPAIARTVTYTSRLAILRTFSGEGIGADNTVTVNGLDTTTTMDAASTPAVTLDACLALALSGGAATLDLTAIADPNLGTVNGTGLHVRVLKLQNPAGNANSITIGVGASNGYTGLGSLWSETLQPGDEVTLLKMAAGAIGSGSKTLDLTGTGAQALNIEIAMG